MVLRLPALAQSAGLAFGPALLAEPARVEPALIACAERYAG
jgi:hypothetical protein